MFQSKRERNRMDNRSWQFEFIIIILYVPVVGDYCDRLWIKLTNDHHHRHQFAQFGQVCGRQLPKTSWEPSGMVNVINRVEKSDPRTKVIHIKKLC